MLIASHTKLGEKVGKVKKIGKESAPRRTTFDWEVPGRVRFIVRGRFHIEEDLVDPSLNFLTSSSVVRSNEIVGNKLAVGRRRGRRRRGTLRVVLVSPVNLVYPAGKRGYCFN
jgi:hypothetical protein